MHHSLRFRRIVLAALAAAALAASAFSVAVAAMAHSPTTARMQTQKRRGAAAAEERKGSAAPFQAGEKLEYTVSWSSFATAASVELSIPERRNLYGWQTWHFRAAGHTMGTARVLFPVDDELDSYSDAATLESREYESYLNELGRKSDQKWQFVPEGGKARAPGPFVIVLPGTHDPVGALYSLRLVDWQSAGEVRVPVCDGHEMYEMRATMEAGSDAVDVPAGSFTAQRIAVRVFQQDAEVSRIHFTVWIADDAARTPVLMEAELPFGTLRIEMTSATR